MQDSHKRKNTNLQVFYLLHQVPRDIAISLRCFAAFLFAVRCHRRLFFLGLGASLRRCRSRWSFRTLLGGRRSGGWFICDFSFLRRRRTMRRRSFGDFVLLGSRRSMKATTTRTSILRRWRRGTSLSVLLAGVCSVKRFKHNECV